MLARQLNRFVPALIFGAYSVKLLLVGSSFADAPILLVLAAIYAFSEYKPDNRHFLELDTKISNLEAQIKEQEKLIESIKTHVSGIKMAQAMKSNSSSQMGR